MTYQEKVKASAKIYNYIQGMGSIANSTEVLDFTYRGLPYTFKSWNYREDTENILSVEKKEDFLLRSMNVEKITSTSLHLYAFDMMGNRTTYKMSLAEMSLA
jgi:hypothetical protein